MNYNDTMIMRQVIMSHYQKPTYKGFLSKDETKRFRINSPECIDDITVELVLHNKVVKSARFEGIACTVGTAATDILCNLIEKNNIKNSLEIIEHFENMLHNKEYNKEIIGELLVFQNTYKQRNRIRCAKTGSDAFKNLLEKGK